MYKRAENQILMPHEFFLPFEGKLNPENRWVKLALMIPWWTVEEKYAGNFSDTQLGGENALSVRVALGSLIIQTREGLSDTKTVEMIGENPYMQYFIGLERFQQKPPFDPSLMVNFRKRLGKDIVNEINGMIIEEARKGENSKDSDKGNPGSGGSGMGIKECMQTSEPEESNKGKLILDATCTPADMHYPTDLWLLNQAREHLEEIIDTLHAPLVGQEKKPRDYRNRARKACLSIEKQRKPGPHKIHMDGN